MGGISRRELVGTFVEGIVVVAAMAAALQMTSAVGEDGGGVGITGLYFQPFTRRISVWIRVDERCRRRKRTAAQKDSTKVACFLRSSVLNIAIVPVLDAAGEGRIEEGGVGVVEVSIGTLATVMIGGVWGEAGGRR